MCCVCDSAGLAVVYSEMLFQKLIHGNQFGEGFLLWVLGVFFPKQAAVCHCDQPPQQALIFLLPDLRS